MVRLEDLRDDKPRFKMLTKSRGEIKCYSIEYRGFTQRIERDIKSYKRKSTFDVLRELFGALVTDANDLPLGGDQLSSLTESEQAEFVDKLIQHHGLIFNDRKAARQPDESATDYVARILIQRAEAMARISGWAGQLTADAMHQAKRLAETTSELRPPDIKLPPHRNPMAPTNEHLASIERRFETSMKQTSGLHDLISSVNTATLGLLDRFAAGAIANENTAKWTIRIAVGALLVAVATPIGQIIYDRYYKPPDTSLQAAVDKLGSDLMAAQNKTANELRSELAATVRLLSDMQLQRRREDQVEDDGRFRDLAETIKSIANQKNVPEKSE